MKDHTNIVSESKPERLGVIQCSEYEYEELESLLLIAGIKVMGVFVFKTRDNQHLIRIEDAQCDLVPVGDMIPHYEFICGRVGQCGEYKLRRLGC